MFSSLRDQPAARDQRGPDVQAATKSVLDEFLDGFAVLHQVTGLARAADVRDVVRRMNLSSAERDLVIDGVLGAEHGFAVVTMTTLFGEEPTKIVGCVLTWHTMLSRASTVVLDFTAAGLFRAH